MGKIEKSYNFKGIDCIKMSHGKYFCVIAPQMGASVLRLRDEQNGIDVFRYVQSVSAEEIDRSREIWGLPTLYLPNRFDGGVVKTSDSEYHLPLNEAALGNTIHGWVHKRPHTVEETFEDDRKCVVVTSFTHGKDDEWYEFFPIDFKISYRFTLSDEGLDQRISLTNLSRRALPVSICTHTTINSPMIDGGEEKDLRLYVPVGKRCELNERCLPTEALLELNEWDKEYLTGKMPTLQELDNDMYTAETLMLDGKEFYGVYVTDQANGTMVINEVSKEFKFWNMWNHNGINHYFCPEPMTAMINCTNLSLSDETTGYTELKKGQVYTCSQRFSTRKATD